MKSKVFLRLSFALLICLSVFTFFSISAGALTEPVGGTLENMQWSLGTDGKLTVTVDGEMPNFGYCYDITTAPWVVCSDSILSVEIQSGATSISEGAFAGCKNITSVIIPDGVLYIKLNAFYKCSSLESVSIPENAVLGAGAFFECSALKSFAIPSGATAVASMLFADCTQLTSVTIPEGVTEIWDNAFCGCTGLTTITIPESVKIIREDVFKGCSSLKSVVIPAGVEYLGGATFAGCTSLTSAAILKETPSIVSQMFYECTSLTSITVREGAKSIGDEAFFGCTNLSSIIIPDSVTSIGRKAFSGCTNLTNITLPSKLTSIGNNAFENCTAITSVTIPEKVETIESYSFSGCNNLSTVKIVGATTVNTYAFKNCSNLTTVFFPKTLKYIKASAFEACDNISVVNYTGSETNKSKITTAVGNDCLNLVTWTYNYHDADTHTYDNYCDTTCNICGAVRVTEHSYRLSYKYNEDGHWKECYVCGATTEPEAHVYTDNSDTVCDLCYYKRSLGIWDGTVANGFESGKGSEKDPYIIKTPEQLAYFANSVNTGTTYYFKYIKLANDIYLNNTDGWEKWNAVAPKNMWTPIGTSSSPFCGTFEGDGHIVLGIYTDTANNYQGLFGYLNGTIKNVRVEQSYICGTDYVGGLCAYNYCGAVINCTNAGAVCGSQYVGGVCGYNYCASVKKSCNNGSVNGKGNCVGGICGYNYSDSVTSCYNAGIVNGSNNDVGGVCGYNLFGFVTNSYNVGSVIGNGCNIGGVCGNNQLGSVMYSFNVGSVRGGSSVGNVCGLNYGQVTNSYYLLGCAEDGNNISQNGIGDLKDTKGETAGLTNEQMQQQSSFAGFDFVNIWAIESSAGITYPQFIRNLDKALAASSAIWEGDIANAFAGGSGTETDPYIIKTAEQLAYLSSSVNSGTNYKGKFLKLANDIVLNDNSKKYWILNATVWTPIGTLSNRFEGTFDGGGNVIRGIYTDANEEYQGLFGYSNGAIKNVGIEQSYICGSNKVGGICGFNGGIIINCYNGANISESESYIGGLCGYNKGTVTDSRNGGTVSGGGKVGGICGANYNTGTVTSSSNNGSVTGGSEIGGICGANMGAGTVKSNANNGSVIGTDDVGGVCGSNLNTVKSCCNSGAIIGFGVTGGVTGYNSGTVTSSSNNGSVTGGSEIGGVCGDNFSSVENCYNNGSVMGKSSIGGLCGKNADTLTSCYNTGNINGAYCFIGGVCGNNEGTLTQCYNSGNVSGSEEVGGVCGKNSGTVTNCYYISDCAKDGKNTVQNGIGNSTAGKITADINGQTCGLTEIQMQQPASFAGFDYKSIWTMPNSGVSYVYPVLRAFNEHTHLIIDNIIDPTCTDQGYTEHTCYCGYETKDTYVNALNHSWGIPSYEWNGDKCTGSRKCKNNPGHIESETVSGTYVKDADATYLENEKGHFIAVFENIAFETQSSAKCSYEVPGTKLSSTYGDVNGDGNINGQDVVRLKKYLANYDYNTNTSTVEIGTGADANGDGVVNGQDVVRLKKYLANYDYDTNTSTIKLGP